MFKCKSREKVVYLITDKGNGNRGVFCSIIFKSSVFVFNKNTGFHRNNEHCSMPILNTRDVRVTRFESSAE